VDTPTIQYVVEEAVNSGIRDILIITRQGKQALENHFDRAFELEASLRLQGREEQLQQVRQLASLANIHFVRQAELNGLGEPLLAAGTWETTFSCCWGHPHSLQKIPARSN
jgi:UTP--glucose-1-phosphate uridylyltransferase